MIWRRDIILFKYFLFLEYDVYRFQPILISNFLATCQKSFKMKKKRALRPSDIMKLPETHISKDFGAIFEKYV